MKTRLHAPLIIGLLAITGIGMGCDREKKDPNADLKTEIVANYANVVYHTYLDALEGARELTRKVGDFLANPSTTSHAEAKQAWLAAREPYGQTEAFRFGDGPIDDADGPEGLLNAWPLDEAYIDYVDGAPNAGIVNDTQFAISRESLIQLNESGGEENISVGYHAVEFLLWGQDDPNVSLQTAGDRPYTDFVTDGSGTAANQARRGQYLQICADLLVENLEELVDAWSPSVTGNYRATFLALDSDEAIRRMLTGIGILSKAELAGERMFTALDNQNQEDEHSCFSDNTHRDIVTNAMGIRNVFRGTYARTNGSVISGASVMDLADILAKDENNTLRSWMDQTITLVNAIPAPFDYALTQESVGGTGPIFTAILSLQKQGDQLALVASRMEIPISTELPD